MATTRQELVSHLYTMYWAINLENMEHYTVPTQRLLEEYSAVLGLWDGLKVRMRLLAHRDKSSTATMDIALASADSDAQIIEFIRDIERIKWNDLVGLVGTFCNEIVWKSSLRILLLYVSAMGKLVVVNKQAQYTELQYRLRFDQAMFPLAFSAMNERPPLQSKTDQMLRQSLLMFASETPETVAALDHSQWGHTSSTRCGWHANDSETLVSDVILRLIDDVDLTLLFNLIKAEEYTYKDYSTGELDEALKVSYLIMRAFEHP